MNNTSQVRVRLSEVEPFLVSGRTNPWTVQERSLYPTKNDTHLHAVPSASRCDGIRRFHRRYLTPLIPVAGKRRSTRQHPGTRRSLNASASPMPAVDLLRQVPTPPPLFYQRSAGFSTFRSSMTRTPHGSSGTSDSISSLPPPPPSSKGAPTKPNVNL